MSGNIRKTPSIEHSLHRVGAIEWPTLALIVACHAVWLAGGLLWAVAPFMAVPLLAITIVFHSSLQHETIHRHPTRSLAWNEALVWLPLGLIVPYRRFREQHLLHHTDPALTDPYDDPESYYLAGSDWERLPRVLQTLLVWNNRLLVRMLLGPAIMAVSYLRAEARALLRPVDRESARRARHAWASHALGVVGVVLIVKFVFAMSFGAYLVAVYGAHSILAVRSFCEHRWAETIAARSVIVEKSALGLLFLNNNLHIVHHAHPGLPWHALPAAYRARREAWQTMNDGYVFQGYSDVLRQFALRAKEPVRHPVRA
jgi:fatty acid desaturase